MKTGPARQALQSFFGLERRQTISRFLYAIIISVIGLDSIMIVVRHWDTSSATVTTPALLLLLLLQFLMLLLLKRGYVNQAAYILVIGSWVVVTYLIWNADGIRDVALYLYFVILLIAALITDWQLIFILSLLSISFIWIIAIAEVQGLRAHHLDAPLSIARDLTAIFILLVILIYLVVNSVARSLDAVREGEKKFRKIFHVSPVAISISTLTDGSLVDANDAFFELTGYKRESAIGKSTVQLGVWQNEGEYSGFIERLLEQKSLQNPAYKFISITGHERTALAFYELIELENKPAVLSMLYDITEQRTAQTALLASERKYRFFVEQSIEGIWYLAFDQPISIRLPAEEQVKLIYERGYMAECNNVLAQMYGYSSSDELQGVHWLDLQKDGVLDPSSYESTLQLVHENYRSGNLETVENTRNGQPVYFLNNTVGIIQDDCLIGLWGTKLDISILKNTEEALRHSETRMRALLNAVPDMIFEISRDGTFLQFIPSSSNSPLLPPEQFLGKTIVEVLPSIADQAAFAIGRALESGDVNAFEYQLFQDGKQKTFEARITPIGPNTVLAMVRDVSLQKWIEDEREKLIVELEQKNVELERFTYTVSHDLKSPLITIRGFLGFIQEDSRKGNLARLDADIQRISAATEKMQALLNDLLELSRVGRLLNEPREINFQDLVKETLELLHGRISQTKATIRVGDHFPTIRGDFDRLLEVLQNLIDNACKFMGNQDHPTIEIGHDGYDGGMPVFYVRDNGIGIQTQFHDKIFGLFNKLDVHSEGTGVGLTLVKRIIEFHGGRIWIESEPGRGTTFFFTLPTPSSR
jgi:two-component system, LuxR family, sensor kinase FixL